MADGLSTISALLREGSRSGIRSLKRELFLPEEIPAFDVLRDYYRLHGTLPTPEVFARAGIQLPVTDTAFSYFVEQLDQRAVYNTTRDLNAALSEALRTRNTESMVRLTREANINLGSLRVRDNVQTAGRVVGDVIEEYTRQHHLAGLLGVTMGWNRLDEITGGAQPSDLVVLLARRGIGKTYAMTKMALDAWSTGNSVLFVTMEMTVEQIVRRMVGMRAGINPDLVRRGMLSNRALSRLRQTANLFRDTDNPPFWMMEGNFSKTTSDVDNIVQEFRPDIVYIDGSYLLKPTRTMARESKWEVQAAIHEELKMQVAMGRTVPVVCSVQVSRKGAGQKSTDGIAAGSDVIEQLASVMIHMTKARGRLSKTHRHMNVIKNRDGPSGDFIINFSFNPLDMSTDTNATVVEETADGARQEAVDAMATMEADMR